MAKTTIAQQIKKYRAELGLTLPELAEMAGVSKGYLWQLENGQNTNPSIDTLVKIAKALGKTVADITHGGPLVKPASPEKINLPVGLRDFVNVMESKGQHITESEIAMLAGIQYRGRKPRTADDWQTLYNVIRMVSKKK